MPLPRKIEIRRRRKRHEALSKLRKRFKEVKSAEEKAKILAKAARISPTATLAPSSKQAVLSISKKPASRFQGRSLDSPASE